MKLVEGEFGLRPTRTLDQAYQERELASKGASKKTILQSRSERRVKIFETFHDNENVDEAPVPQCVQISEPVCHARSGIA